MVIENIGSIDWNEVYHNPNLSDVAIKQIAAVIANNQDINLEKQFDLLKCSSKFCWLNFLCILENMPIEDRVRGSPLLFELLQDSNWPTYQKTMELLESFSWEVIAPYADKDLKQAQEENDDMWIYNIEKLKERKRL